MWPFLILQASVLMIVVFYPDLALWLPSLGR
jgi:TRAP-type C4-dicarboxylate transport system permease large subunit